MGLETASFIPELNSANPAGASDPKSEGDNHIKLIKTALLGSFPAFVGTAGTPKSVSLTEDQINDAALKSADNTLTGALITDDSTTARAGLNVPTGVAPTSPNQGDIWATATDLLAYINGVATSLLVGVAPEFKHKTADQTITSDDTLTDDDDLAGFALEAGEYYAVDGCVILTASTVPDFKAKLSFTETEQDYYVGFQGANQNGAQAADATGTGLANVFFGPGSGIKLALRLTGFIKAHATLASTATLQWAQNTSDAGATILHDGSWVSLRKLT